MPLLFLMRPLGEYRRFYWVEPVLEPLDFWEVLDLALGDCCLRLLEYPVLIGELFSLFLSVLE